MKILVTGANGFIGQHLCAQLTSEGDLLVPVVRSASSVPNAVTLTGDTEAGWEQALAGTDAVIHLAGQAHGLGNAGKALIDEFRAANVDYTTALARRAPNAGVRRFIFVSTIKVNGEVTPEGTRFASDDRPNPQDPYAVSKLEAEQALTSLAHKTPMDLIIVRPHLVYGPGVKGNFATIMKSVRRRIPLPFRAVRNRRSLIGVENLTSFLSRCATMDSSRQLLSEVFLVSDGTPLSTPQLITKIAEAFDVKPVLISVPPSVMRAGARLIGRYTTADRLLGSLVLDDHKARQMMEWHPPLSIDEQLRRMANAAGS